MGSELHDAGLLSLLLSFRASSSSPPCASSDGILLRRPSSWSCGRPDDGRPRASAVVAVEVAGMALLASSLLPLVPPWPASVEQHGRQS